MATVVARVGATPCPVCRGLAHGTRKEVATWVLAARGTAGVGASNGKRLEDSRVLWWVRSWM